jgi:hypothetical protein
MACRSVPIATDARPDANRMEATGSRLPPQIDL